MRAAEFLRRARQGRRFGSRQSRVSAKGAIQFAARRAAQLGGRIQSLHALCEILDLRLANKRVFEALIKSGPAIRSSHRQADLKRSAFLRQARARLLASNRCSLRPCARTQRDKDFGQSDLFGDSDEHGAPGHAQLPEVPSWTEIEQLNYERRRSALLDGAPD
jgi:DNA polymerase III alpha subunit